MINTLLIIFPLLIPLVVLGQFFVRLFSHCQDKYERIYRAFSHTGPSFVPGGQGHLAELLACSRYD